jgi:hypothetical protein
MNLLTGRFTGTCGCGCGRTWRDPNMWNAHHLAKFGGYWAGDKARKTGRKIGKAADAMRKHARAVLEAHGHVDRLGRRTDRARSRPGSPLGRPEEPFRGHLGLRALRQMHRHGKDHDRAERAVSTHTGRAERHQARGRDVRASISRGRAADVTHRLRTAWPVRPAPERAAPAPSRPAPGGGNGTRPAPARTVRTVRTVRTPPDGRTRT